MNSVNTTAQYLIETSASSSIKPASQYSQISEKAFTEIQ